MRERDPRALDPGACGLIEEEIIHRSIGWSLVLVLSLAAVLRLGGVWYRGDEYEHTDELHTVARARQASVASVIERLGASGRKQTAYYVFVHWIFRFFPSNLPTVRAISAVAGVLSVLGIYLLARALFDRATGLLAATLLAVLRYHIYFSAFGRVYTIVILLSICSAYLLLLMVRDLRPHWRIAPLYVACAAALMYSHYFGIMLVAMQIAVIFVLACRHRGSLLAPLGALVMVSLTLLYLPLVPTLLADVTEAPELHWIRPPERASEILTLTSVYLLGFGFATPTPIGGLAVVLLCVWAVKGAQSAAQRARAYALVVWAFLPIMFIYYYSLTETPLFVPRYMSMCIPPMLILMAFAVRSLIRKSRLPVVALGLVVWQLTSLSFESGGLWRFHMYEWETSFRSRTPSAILLQPPGGS